MNHLGFQRIPHRRHGSSPSTGGFKAAARLLLLLSAALLSGPAQAESRSPRFEHEILAPRYAEALSYRDRGRLEISAPGQEPRLFSFETRRQGEEVEWRLTSESGAEARVWRLDGQTYVFRGALNEYRAMAGWSVALADLLGPEGFDGLGIPLALGRAPEPFGNPDGVSTDPPEPCGQWTCIPISVSAEAGRWQLELSIDQQQGWIRRLVSRRSTPTMGRRVSRFDLDDQRAAKETVVTVEVTHISEQAGEPLSALPPQARQVELWSARSPAAPPPEVNDPTAAFSEEITVRRLRFRVHAVDRSGRPLPHLKPEDFAATWQGQPIPVVAVDWMEADRPDPLSPLDRAELKALGHEPEPVGRRVVIFAQSALEPVRRTGHRRLLHLAEEILDTLAEQDQVAVVSFDSRLKLWLDWTQDRQAVKEALGRATLGFGELPPPIRQRNRKQSSLARHWDRSAAARTASPERALELTAQAMAPLAGEKVMIYLGWGLGRYSREGVRMTAQYDRAVAALEEARTSVFVLDVTDADYHSLEIGLQSVADATGGAYYRTHQFARQAVKSLAATLAGHYVVTLDASALSQPLEDPSNGDIDLRLLVPKSRILGPPLSLH